MVGVMESNGQRNITSWSGKVSVFRVVAMFLAGIILINVAIGSRANAAEVYLSGMITEGSFFFPAQVTNPDGSTSIQNIDQLGQTGAPLSLLIEFDHAILASPLEDGKSFLKVSNRGYTETSAVTVSGTFGDLAFDGFSFETQLRRTGDVATFMDRILTLELALIGDNGAGPGTFLGASQPFGEFRLMSPPVPEAVETVGQLVDFLNMTSLISTGTIPVEFFLSTPIGTTNLVSADLPFELRPHGGEIVVAEVPLPAAGILFVFGVLGGAAGMRRRKNNCNQ